jgi:hypothetical protein
LAVDNRSVAERCAIAAVALTCAADLLHRFWPVWALPGGFDDDFFYYAQIARELARGHGSTFDGVHMTNGYHPLWLLCLTGLWAIGDGRFFFLLVTLVTFVSLASTFLLCARCLERLEVPRQGRGVIAAAVVFWSVLIMRGGMEVVAVIPLLLGLLWMWLDEAWGSAGKSLLLGLVAAFSILARLDSVLLVGVLLVLSVGFEVRSIREGARRAGAFALGLMPVWLYLIGNRFWFATWMPVSAEAKELLVHRGFNWQPLAGLFEPLSGIRLMIVLPGIVGVCALLALVRKRQIPSSRRRTVLWSLALFPIIQISLLCWLSDWTIWYWYFYPLVLAAMGGMAAWAVRYVPGKRVWTALSATLVAGCAVHLFSYHVRHPPRTNPMLLAARDILMFAGRHPGIYAMGDRAGTVGFLLSSPVYQLEGLTMDREYLDVLRRQPPLRSVLQEYRVDYYISTNAVPDGDCFDAVEPAMAGPDSARMSGKFCGPLVTLVYDGKVTRIFKVDGAP